MRNLLLAKVLCIAAIVFAGVNCTDSKPPKWTKSSQDKASSDTQNADDSTGSDDSSSAHENEEKIEEEAKDPSETSEEGFRTEPDTGQDKVAVYKNPMTELMEENIAKARAKGEKVRTFQNMAVHLDSNRVEIVGNFAITYGVIELFACTPGGKEHETICVLDVDPEELMLALMLMGKRPTPAITTFEEATAITGGDRVTIYIEWDQVRRGVKKHVRRRAEDLLYNIYTRTSMKHAGWVFTGSLTVRHPQTNELVLVAKYKRSLIVTLHDPSAILDTPLMEGGYDTTYVANGKNMPISGTPLLLTIVPEE
ncbi:MAG: hypothetical protein E3J72_11840 [Planctomycetota bacterium]|nr:MAG: hypothetical protein E3J72_11840 [Planctomycetota bacterium]